MKAAKLLATRRENWHALDELCHDLEKRGPARLGAPRMTQFASLYRAACADLALADAYQLPPNTVDYLHQLVGRAHNQLYRSRRFEFSAWREEMFVALPQRLFRDRTLWLAMAIFWGVFLGAMVSAVKSPHFAETVLGEGREQLDESFSHPMSGRDTNTASGMAGFYVMHNTGIGLQCFALGLLFGIGGLLATVFNAMFLGAAFGYMSNSANAPNFFNFVTAHGPCELMAIVFSAAAGMRLGFALVNTQGLSRSAALEAAGREAMPTMGAAMVLFAIAALIEGFVSPSGVDYTVKAAVAVICGLMIFVYVCVLGFPRKTSLATR